MSAACACPDVQIDLVHPIPTGPLTCVCCGQPIIITCAGGCGEPHVRASFAAATKALRAGRSAPRRLTPVEAPREPLPHCERCEAVITPTRGRPRKPLVCDACLTPIERSTLEARKRYREQRARRVANEVMIEAMAE